MTLKPKRKSLRNPSVFKNETTGQWVCEYEEYNNDGKIVPRRKSFKQQLKKEGKPGTLAEQRAAAHAFQKELIQKQRKDHNLSRTEREQKILTPKQLKAAKTAFGILSRLPKQKQDIIEAAKRYVDECRLEKDSPAFDFCMDLFLKDYDAKDPACTYSVTTINTMHQKLRPFRRYILSINPNIKIGEVTAQHVSDFIKSRDVSPTTRKKDLSYITQFFGRFSNPEDPHRFLNSNPAALAKLNLQLKDKSVLQSHKKARTRIIRILQVEETRRALRVAYEARQHGILGYAVLAILVGMRPSEIYDLAKQDGIWEKYIKLDEGILIVDGFGKQSDQRTIDLEPVAVDWLRYIKKNDLPICYAHNPNGRNIRYANFRALTLLSEEEGRRYVAIRRRIDQQKEVSREEREFIESRQEQLIGENVDAYRHTYGTNLYYKSNYDLKYVTAQMGNSESVYYKHYKGKLSKPGDFEKFFLLSPSECL